MVSIHFALSDKKDGKKFGILLMLTSLYVTFICFNAFLLHFAFIYVGIGIIVIYGFFYFFRAVGTPPTFLEFRSPFEEEEKPKLNRRSFVILGFIGARLVVALLVFLEVDFVFVAIGITIIDLINSKIIILTGKSLFWDKIDNNLDIFSRLIAVVNFLYLWWIPVTIALQYIIYVVREIDIRYTWLRTFPPDVIWLVFAVDYGGLAMFILSIAIFILNLLSYSLITGRNGVLLRPS